MRKKLVTLTLAAFVSTMAVESAQAAGFFESLFGPRKQSTGKRRFVYENDKVRIIRGNGNTTATPLKPKGGNVANIVRSGKPAPSYADPEPIPGLGMGNPVYTPIKMLVLADPAFTKIDPATAGNGALLAVLSNVRNNIRTEEPLRVAILKFYKENGFKPLWLDNGKISERALKVLDVAKNVDQDGLDPKDYLPAGLTSFDAAEAQVGTDAEKQAAFDVAMTASAVRLAAHLSGGRFDANRLSLYNDLPSQRVSPAVALGVLAHSPFPETYIKGLAPTLPVYGQMKEELARLRSGGDVPEATIIPEGDTIRRNGRDPRILLVRDRLNALGFIPADAETVDTEDADKLDDALMANLKQFQASVGLKADGRLGNGTVKKLNVDSRSSDIQRLVYNLERVRWLPKTLTSHYVFVNQPAFEVRVMDQGKQVWRSNVIVGRQMTQTASFYDEMETVVFNPTWGLPQSIIVNEYLKKLIRDPGYFDRIGYKVVNQKGKPVSSRSVNWAGYSQNNPVGVQQPAGNDNALGELKFLFPNAHSIYMHDTPTKNLFSQTVRAYSHGCVRVQDPREFATVLLGWNRQKVDEMTDSRNSQSVALPKKIPIYLTYFTAWPDETGKIRYYNDIYERDAAMQRAIDGVVNRNTTTITGNIVQN